MNRRRPPAPGEVPRHAPVCAESPVNPFTGAYRDKAGKLEMADGGTMFLDEVGEMTLRMQGILLRFLETGELQKVGTERAGRRVDVRVVAATNRNLQKRID